MLPSCYINRPAQVHFVRPSLFKKRVQVKMLSSIRTISDLPPSSIRFPTLFVANYSDDLLYLTNETTTSLPIVLVKKWGAPAIKVACEAAIECSRALLIKTTRAAFIEASSTLGQLASLDHSLAREDRDGVFMCLPGRLASMGAL